MDDVFLRGNVRILDGKVGNGADFWKKRVVGKNFSGKLGCVRLRMMGIFGGREGKVGTVEMKFRREQKKINSGNRKKCRGKSLAGKRR